MRLTDLQKKLLKTIRSNLTNKDLVALCIFCEICSTGLKRSIQDRLELYITNKPDKQLMLINNRIDEYLNLSKKSNVSVIDAPEPMTATYTPDTLSDNLLQLAPISLDEEVAKINRNAVVVVHFTSYPANMTAVPSQMVTGINERAHNLRLPNMLPNVSVEISPFYCGVVCLHPLSMLIPTNMPNINQTGRINSQTNFQFVLSDDAQKLISKNTTRINGKIDYKWQVLLRFVSVDPTTHTPIPGQTVSQIMPPYVTVSVNNDNVPLWDVLPSNCRLKEGKRHPKAINITDKLGGNRITTGNKQNITINWWQTPGIFQYYYMGVYLERKLSVGELLDVLASDRHVNVLPVETTLSLIKSKLQTGKYRNNEEDDDLVVSSVLPISLSCPVGRGRIEIPIRTLKCQHLQCFDAHLFLSMNERRSSWKCPVCESSATPNELFCDQYFKIILNVYKDNDDVVDINVSSDGSYVPVSRRKNDSACTDSGAADNTQTDMVVLDSDDDDQDDQTKSCSENRHKLTEKERYYAAKDTTKYPTKPAQSKGYEIFSPITPHRAKPTRSPRTVLLQSSTANTDVEGSARLNRQKVASKSTAKTALPSVVSAPLVSTPLLSAPLSLSIDPQLFNPLSLASRTSMPVIQAPNHTTTLSSKHSQEQSNETPSTKSSAAPILAPTSLSTLPPVVTSFSEPIPAPNNLAVADSGVARKSMFDAIVSPVLNPAKDIVHTPTPALKVDVISAHAPPPSSRSPISAPIFESQIKLKSTPKTAPIRYTEQSFDVVRTIKDVVKTLPTGSTTQLDSAISEKKVVAQPINCPVTIIDQSSPATSDDDVTLLNRAATGSKPGASRLATKVVPSNVYIPTVSIDLTEDDDDVEENTTVVNAHPLNGRGVKYCDVNDLAFRRSLYNTSGLPNKFSSADQRRTVFHAVNPNIRTHQCNTAKRPLNSNPVDLTGDDEDDQESPSKKPRMNGVVRAPRPHNSDSDSSSEGSLSSLSDAGRRDTRMDMNAGGRMPPSTFRG